MEEVTKKKVPNEKVCQYIRTGTLALVIKNHQLAGSRQSLDDCFVPTEGRIQAESGTKSKAVD